MFDNWLPKIVDPVTNSVEDVIVCTTIFWAVNVPATVKLSAYDDVKEYDAVVAFRA